MSERELLLVPGLTMVEAEVLEALAQEPLSHVDSRFGAIFSEMLSQTRRLFQLTGGAVFLLAGSGTLAMEMPEDRPPTVSSRRGRPRNPRPQEGAH